MHNARISGHRYTLHPIVGSLTSYDCFSTMVPMRTRRPTMETTPCTKCHKANTNPKNMVSVLHGYCWSGALMWMHNVRTNGHHYTLHPAMGIPASYDCFSIMVPTRTRCQKMETTPCTKYVATRKTNPKKMVSTLYGY